MALSAPNLLPLLVLLLAGIQRSEESQSKGLRIKLGTSIPYYLKFAHNEIIGNLTNSC